MRPALILVVLALIASGAILRSRRRSIERLETRQAAWGHTIAPGDLLFQDLDCGERCDLIRLVTQSKYTHVGLVLADEQGHPVVWEAFSWVRPTSLTEFIERGRDQQIAIFQLEPALLKQLPRITAAAQAMAGRPYDDSYQWDDAQIYCSELVEKAVEAGTGVDLARPHALGDLGQYADEVRQVSRGHVTGQSQLTTPADLARSHHVRMIVDELGEL